jgi:FtsP/CotA-like multicopper oxidase with cupredoxin domain
MAGLIVGVHVSPATAGRPAPDPRPRRRLRVFVTQRANVYGDVPGYSYVLQKASKPPARDSIQSHGSTLVLRQNEPSEITVVNATTNSTSVHWHGIEIESFYDGVGDWSGWGTRVATPIAPGDSFVVRLTPPRAGTFIYHTHTSEGVSLASGLYGALVVIPENTVPDTTDRVALVAIGGPLDDSRPVVNGSSSPPPIELRAGVAYRFRLINISPLETHRIQLAVGDTTQTWRALAKDGADLPPHQATTQPAFLALHPGETYDFEVRRERPGVLTLRVNSPGTVADRATAIARQVPAAQFPRIIMEIPVIVR